MRVRWEIDIEARTAREAARRALGIQRDPESIATVFDVTGRHGRIVRVDLGQSGPPKPKARVSVRGGVAYLDYCPAGMEVEIMDYDNREES